MNLNGPSIGKPMNEPLSRKKAPNPGDGWALMRVLRGAPGGMPAL
jgi:hypothetical protein